MILTRGGIAMAFFKRELGPIERFENALKEKQTARQKLADRLSVAETELAEKRTAAERLAVAGAANARLDRAEAAMRAVEDLGRQITSNRRAFDARLATLRKPLVGSRDCTWRLGLRTSVPRKSRLRRFHP